MKPIFYSDDSYNIMMTVQTTLSYIFNAVAFDKVSMQWIVVARIRLNVGWIYTLKIFDKCRSSNDDFELRSTLQGIVTDWSDVEINAVGKKTADHKKLLKGCKVHWQRSCECVAHKVLSSRDKERERSNFLKDLLTDPSFRKCCKDRSMFRNSL